MEYNLNDFTRDVQQKIVSFILKSRKIKVETDLNFVVRYKQLPSHIIVVLEDSINHYVYLSEVFTSTQAILNADDIFNYIKRNLFNNCDDIVNTVENLNVLELDDETISRFSSASWFSECQKIRITIGGVGGIGSHTAMLLSRLHPNTISIYDDDIVEAHNLSGQYYTRDDVGKSKVMACKNAMERYSNFYSINSHNNRVDESTYVNNVVIACFDNMEARKILFENWLAKMEYNDNIIRANCLYIDGRLSAEEFQIFCIKGDDDFNINKYKTGYLFDDSEALPTLCSYKQTSHIANMIASYIVNLFTNFVHNNVSEVQRNLPFFTYYNAETMHLITKL